MYGRQYTKQWQPETAAHDLFELPEDCPKCCPKCGGKRVRIPWNHKNTNSDFAYCSECDDRPAIGNIQKRFTGAPSKPRRRGNLPVTPDWVFERDAWRCQRCGRDAMDDVKLEVSHILSRADAIAQNATEEEINDPGNLFAGCHDCNNERGDISMPPIFVLRLIRARMRRGQQ